MLAVANSRNEGCGWITRLWSSSVRRPSSSSTRWITNITSARPASYSSNTSAHGRCSAQVSIPGWNSVICLPSRTAIVSLPIRSMRVTCPSRFTRTHGQLSRAATCSMWLDLPVPWRPLHQHAPVVQEAGQERQRRVPIEHVVGIQHRHVLVLGRERRHPEVRVDLEEVARGQRQIGRERQTPRPANLKWWSSVWAHGSRTRPRVSP